MTYCKITSLICLEGDSHPSIALDHTISIVIPPHDFSLSHIRVPRPFFSFSRWEPAAVNAVQELLPLKLLTHQIRTLTQTLWKFLK